MNINNKLTNTLTVENISKLLTDLARLRFWGQVQIDYQDGEPILVRKSETLKSLKGNTYANSDTYNR